jgi:hypothetical protein
VHCVRPLERAGPHGKRSGVTAREDERSALEALAGQSSHVGGEIDTAEGANAVERSERGWYGGPAAGPDFEDTVSGAELECVGDQAIAASIEKS